MWKLLGHIGRVFLRYLEPPNSRIVKIQQISSLFLSPAPRCGIATQVRIYKYIGIAVPPELGIAVPPELGIAVPPELGIAVPLELVIAV